MQRCSDYKPGLSPAPSKNALTIQKLIFVDLTSVHWVNIII